MSKSVNQCIIIGNCGKDPEVRVLEGGIKVATFSVATSTGGYEKSDGTKIPEKTQWHNVVCWRGFAEIAEKYIHKGDKITIMGSISYREYENDKKEKRHITDIVAYDLILSGKTENHSKPTVVAQDAPLPDDFPPTPPKDDLPF